MFNSATLCFDNKLLIKKFSQLITRILTEQADESAIAISTPKAHLNFSGQKPSIAEKMPQIIISVLG